MTHFCWEASYLNYNRISHKARCSMAPRNCPHEISEILTLKTGKQKQVWYCTFSPDNEKEKTIDPHKIQPSKYQIGVASETKTATQIKTSCRLDSGN
jgi:hypothetical protein